MPPPRPRSKPKRWWGGAMYFGCALVAFCGLGGFFLIARIFKEDSARLPSNLDIAHERGLPLTPQDIAALSQHYAPADNAAPIYRQALQVFRNTFGENGPDPIYRNITKNWSSRAHHRNVAFQPTLRLLRLAAQRPICDFQDNPDTAYKRLFSSKYQSDDTTLVRMVGVVFGVALENLRDYDRQAAFEKAEILLAISHQTPKFSTYLRAQWGAEAGSYAIQILLRMVQQDPRDSEVLDRAQTLAESFTLPDLYCTIQAEFVDGIQAVHKIKSLEDVGLDKNTPKAFSQTVDNLYQSPAVRDAFEARYVKVYLDFFKALPKDSEDWPDIHRVTTKIRKELDADTSLDGGIARALTPAYPYLVWNHASQQAMQRLLLTAIQILKTNRFDPKAPISQDPFINAPLHYRKDPTGFTLYSVGQNQRDDHGLASYGPDRKDQDDIVFSVHLAHQSLIR